MPPRPAPALAAVTLTSAALFAQDPTQQRLEQLERDNRQLQQRLEQLEARTAANEQGFQALGQEVERFQIGEVLTGPGESRYGLGPAASKVYGVEQGLSIGGYGEFLFEQRSGRPDVFDALRAIVYVGYKFDDRWVLNTEIEIEHGTTDPSSGTTDSGGSVSLEFGYLDYLYCEGLNVRAGVVLPPMGFLNELHEPTTFLGAQRPLVEQRIIPSTWRAPGAGIFGDVGGFSYRAYGVTSLNGEAFDESGLRGGRQKANRAAADDFALTARLDWTDTPGLIAGTSIYWGDTGQDGVDGDGNAIPALNTTIVDVHVDWRPGPLWLRALYASAWLDDTQQFFAATGTSLARRMDGGYVEAGYDLLAALAPESGQMLYAFSRFETIDTQRELASAVPAVPGQDDRAWTFGLHWRPIPQVVVKADYQDFDESFDRFNLLLGYIF